MLNASGLSPWGDENENVMVTVVVGHCEPAKCRQKAHLKMVSFVM